VAIPSGAQDVVDAEQLRQVAGALAQVTELAVDVEADSMHHYRSRLCYVQLGTDHEIFLLDTLRPEVRADALASVFGAASPTKIFHAAQGDLAYLAEAGVRVRGLFDTHRAATLLGWPKVGLADLVLQHQGATLKKEHQQADFSQRPLPPELRDYIADDVRYLVEVGRAVRQACVEADILEEVLLDCDRLCDEATVRPDPLTAFTPKLPRLEGGPTATARAAQLAQALHVRRLAWAEADDVPMGRMLSNMAVVAIASKPPSTLRDLGRLAGVRGAFVRAHGDEVLALARELAAAGDPPAPGPARERDPKRRRREESLLAWRKARATERKVTPSVVLPNLLVEDLARLNPASPEALGALPYLGPKRLALYGEQLLAVLAQP
jgi:ribonuclease D